MKAYEDQSIFQNIAQYVDEDRQGWRREGTHGDYKFYKLEEDTFIFDGVLYCDDTLDIKQVHELYLQNKI